VDARITILSMAIVNQHGLRTQCYFPSHLPGDALPNSSVSLGFRTPRTARVTVPVPLWGNKAAEHRLDLSQPINDIFTHTRVVLSSTIMGNHKIYVLVTTRLITHSNALPNLCVSLDSKTGFMPWTARVYRSRSASKAKAEKHPTAIPTSRIGLQMFMPR